MISARSELRALGKRHLAFRPGSHSRNQRRRKGSSNSTPAMQWLKRLLLLVGLGCIGFYAYTLADEYIYQRFENWAFDQQIAGRNDVSFADYARERTPLGLLLSRSAAGSRAETKPFVPPAAPHLAEGDLVGRVAIDRLKLSAVIREGVSDQTLKTSVGHIPTTTLPGGEGNFAIAAHRDTLFRALKDIRNGDLVSVQSPSATYTYRVIGTRIVKPSDVSVLRADGGGLHTVEAGSGQLRLLTMITCYPFYYVGSAPKRFIVQAELVKNQTEPASKAD
jgi:sortase A